MIQFWKRSSMKTIMPVKKLNSEIIQKIKAPNTHANMMAAKSL